MNHARALALIEQLLFRVAKSMPRIPHEYTVRDKDDLARETAYVQLFHLIQSDGEIERWQGRKTRFLDPGDGWKYWAMTTIEAESRMMNRMRSRTTLSDCAGEARNLMGPLSSPPCCR